jgi:hypothetical protein
MGGRIASTIGELQQVQQDVKKASGTDNVTVNLNNGTSLSVGLLNSSLGTLPSDQKKAKALEVAQIAYRSYPQRAKLDEVSVAYIVHRTYLGVFNYTDSRDAFNFATSELQTPDKQ